MCTIYQCGLTMTPQNPKKYTIHTTNQEDPQQEVKKKPKKLWQRKNISTKKTITHYRGKETSATMMLLEICKKGIHQRKRKDNPEEERGQATKAAGRK